MEGFQNFRIFMNHGIDFCESIPLSHRGNHQLLTSNLDEFKFLSITLTNSVSPVGPLNGFAGLHWQA